MSAALIMATPPNTATESFDALYRECARDIYAYVRRCSATTRAPRTSRRWPSSAPTGAARASTRAAAASAAGCSASRATRRSTSCAGASARRRSSATCPTTTAGAPEEEADLAIRRTTVRVALAALAPRDRELVALKFHGGLSNAEIAAVLGTTESNAGTRVHRAVSKLREACNAPS